MEILASKQIRVLLDLLTEGIDIQPILSSFTSEDKHAIVYVLNKLIKEINNND